MAKTLPHGLPFAPVKVGVLIDIDMGTTPMAGKCRTSARCDTFAMASGHAGVMRGTRSCALRLAPC